jgi:glutathionylspermidine amidase/synthetase
MDVLLQPQLAVHEPLWTVIPSNKAILPLLRELHPHHPCLLRSQLTLDPALRASGYVAKPIAGRCGFNVSMFDQDDRLLRETPGRFQHSELVYQELFPLPRVDRYHVQVSTFTVQGRYAGSCVRVDPSPVISSHSDLLALRIVDDVDHTPPDRDSGDGRRPRPRSASAARGSRRR